MNSTLAMRSCSAMPRPPLRQVPIACNRGLLGKGYSAIVSSNKVIEAFGTSIISSSIAESE